jgi:hypothetical protein
MGAGEEGLKPTASRSEERAVRPSPWGLRYGIAILARWRYLRLLLLGEALILGVGLPLASKLPSLYVNAGIIVATNVLLVLLRAKVFSDSTREQGRGRVS